MFKNIPTYESKENPNMDLHLNGPDTIGRVLDGLTKISMTW